jgi:hypothetical protein
MKLNLKDFKIGRNAYDLKLERVVQIDGGIQFDTPNNSDGAYMDIRYSLNNFNLVGTEYVPANRLVLCLHLKDEN